VFRELQLGSGPARRDGGDDVFGSGRGRFLGLAGLVRHKGRSHRTRDRGGGEVVHSQPDRERRGEGDREPNPGGAAGSPLYGANVVSGGMPLLLRPRAGEAMVRTRDCRSGDRRQQVG